MADVSTIGAAVPATDELPLDRLTIVCIAILAYALADVLHEAVGHGGACLLSGGQPIALSSIRFECSAVGRLVAAGGTLVNFTAGLLLRAVLRLVRNLSPHVRYFVWLSMTVNLLQAAGYFMFSGVGNFGDWAVVISGLKPSWLWRLALTLVGASLYFLFVWIAAMELRPLIGDRRPASFSRAKRLTLTAYFTGGLLACVSAMLNPVGIVWVAVSAAAGTFGFTSGLAWMAQLVRQPRGEITETAVVPPLPRSWGWVTLAAIVAVVFIAVLGPGIRFRYR